MKISRILFVAMVCTLMFTLVACDEGGTPDVTPPVIVDPVPLPTPPEPTPAPIMAEMYEYDIDNPDSPFYLPAEGRFLLTDTQQAHYDEYIRTGDLAVLYGLDPVSVLKIWIEAGIEGEIEREFAMFHPDSLEDMTFELYYAHNMSDGMEGTARGRRRIADIFFAEMENGEITQENGRATISFYTEVGERLSLYTILNDDGIWMVEWLWF